MKCYNHSERDSVAICLACGRSFCRECVRETEAGIACSGKCADVLLKNRKFQTELAAHLKNTRRSSLLSSFFSMGMGILFIVFSRSGFGLVYKLIFLLGLGFTIYGFMVLFVDMIIFLRQRKKKHRR
jgi:hypothetical protein